ncbi:hypothetical protein ACHQM5_026486 [Ranunculus cassubicifolius]
MTSLAPPINAPPINTAGTDGLHPMVFNTLSISLPVGSWSSSYTLGCTLSSWNNVLME